MERIKLIKMVVGEIPDPKRDKFVYIQKTSISLKGFLNKFHDEPITLETLIAPDLHRALDQAQERVDYLPDVHFTERFEAEFKETKAKFLKLWQLQKGVILSYIWGEDGDYTEDVIAILQPEDLHLGLTSPDPILRQASMEIMKNFQNKEKLC
jgi:hypothetical protein